MTILRGTNPTHNYDQEQGSSLIGMAILMLALGFIVTGALYLMQNYDTIQSDQTSVENMREIETALLDFVAREKRYPCPAPLNIAPDQTAADGSEFGKESSGNCTGAINTGTYRALGRDSEPVRIGAIPVRTLNLSDKHMVDGYGKRYFYAITEALATPGTDPRSDLGVISINTQNGDPISDVSGHIIYAIISPGTDNRGAFDEQGNLLEPCELGTNAGDNCSFTQVANPIATFTASSEKNFGVGSNTFTHNFAFRANAIPYRWNAGPWDECGERLFSLSPPRDICFSGHQFRDVECRDNRENVVPIARESDPDRCGHTPRPIDERVCSLPPCEWNTGLWGNCTAGAGIGGGAIGGFGGGR